MSDGSNINPEFIAEAQEIVDALNRDLIAAESESKGGDVSPDRVNNLFRSAHSLKGISGMFGVEPVTRLAHALESVLDGMRMGRVRMEAGALDILFACVEEFGVLIAGASAGDTADEHRLDSLVANLDVLAGGGTQAVAQDPLQTVALGQDVLSVLTEYEEHRLRENIRRGSNLYILRTSFDLNNFDMGLAELDAVIKDIGEVITKLPSSQATDPGTISFDIIAGCHVSSEELVRALADDRVEVIPVQRTAFVVDVEPVTPPAPQTAPAPPPPSQAEQPDVEDEEPSALEVKDTLTVKSVSQTVRVDIKRLDRLMNLVGELALTKIAFQSISDALKNEMGFAGLAADLHKVGRDFERRLNELQSGIMDVRMVPLANLFERMVRVGRKSGRELGKEVRISVSGEHTELDKLIVEDLADPLMHLIRNAIDHGIESPDEREARGKPREGFVRLSAQALGNHVVVRVTDDGQGIDTEFLKAHARERGLISNERASDLNRREALNLIFMPGFSTREKVSEYSGRGVGMDVVKTNISQLSGVIDVDSEPGEGTTIIITLPITLAIIPALIVVVGKETYAIPLNNVMETLALDEYPIRTIERREVISVRGSTVPLLDLRRIFGQEEDVGQRLFAVIAGVGESRIALAVDDLIGQQDIVIKSLGKRFRDVPGIAGATELGNQRIILVVDTVDLLNELTSSDVFEEAYV